ncbi:MAG TPA: hypothetical protein VEC14_03305, partial [Reyranellaceae bacterium]|nr:hypothetical protein [Reyranellaceae bacterium]
MSDDKIVPFNAAPAPASSPANNPASPTPAAAAPPDPAEAFETKAGLEEYYFEDLSRSFWLKNEAGKWVDLSETAFKRHLKKKGLRDKANAQAGEAISPMDEMVRHVEQDCRVGYAGLLAGYRAGVHVVTGRRVLVTEDPVFLTPAPGEWPVLRAFFDGLLVGREPSDDAGGFVAIDQRDYFFGWLQHAAQSYYDGRITNGLALGMAGEPDCGKSFLTWVMRQIFGGRVGKPYSAMTGEDKFNRDGAESVLQLVDDENQADTRLDMRQKFASEIKKFVAN